MARDWSLITVSTPPGGTSTLRVYAWRNLRSLGAHRDGTRQFHEELALERRRGRTTYTELEESDADLARYQKWLAAIRARDYFDAPGGQQAAAAVASCEEALARFESEALSAELDESAPPSRPGLHAVEDAND